MKQLGFGLTFLSALVLATGCTDEASVADETQTGKATFALTADGYSIALSVDIYAIDATPLVDAPIDNVSSAIDDELTELTANLPVGSYNPEMVSWSMTGPGIEGTAESGDDEDNVAFVNFVPDPFSVTPGDVTPVSMEFTVNLETVIITLGGEGNFTANVTVSDECDLACGPGEVCASVDGAAATCVTECDPTAPGITCGDDECLAVVGGEATDGICVAADD